MKQIYKPIARDKKAEKLAFLQKYALKDWIKARREADEEVSKEHEMFCVCGKLCTGLHEGSCQRFRNKVDSRAINKLKHLWKENKVVFPEALK